VFFYKRKARSAKGRISEKGGRGSFRDRGKSHDTFRKGKARKDRVFFRSQNGSQQRKWALALTWEKNPVWLSSRRYQVGEKKGTEISVFNGEKGGRARRLG